jgi:hypothetical protein
MYSGTLISDLTDLAEMVREGRGMVVTTKKATEADWARFLGPHAHPLQIVRTDLDDIAAEEHFGV